MGQLTTITTCVAAATAGALATLGAVVALGNPTGGDNPDPPSVPADVTLVRPAGIILNGIDLASPRVSPAATAIEYGLIAAVDLSVDNPSATTGELNTSAVTDLAVAGDATSG
ncbi:MAG: hypothetical protein J2P22_19255 [Nocardioides sp.]|nr:hypothetical protein [Nocardioides sp.]